MSLETASPNLPRTAAEPPTARRPRECPVEQALEAIGHRWTALIVWHLRPGPLRHAELVRRLPRVTPKVLTERLRELESLGVVSRTVYAEVPVRVDYSLTAHGLALSGILDGLELWWTQGSEFRET